MSNSSSLRLSARIPFLLALVVIGAATIFTAVVRLSDSIAINPWEPAIAMEAVRFNAGLPIYESAHATHMYGPLLTVLLAGIFRITGLSLVAARVALSICAILLSIFLALVFRREKSLFWTAFAVLLFFATNFRTNLALFSAQPDCIALLIASIGLLVWAKFRQRGSAAIAAILLFVIATFFKQTAAAVALVPIVFALLWRPRTFVSALVSALPAFVIGLLLFTVKFFAPEIFHAMVTVPASIQVHWERAPKVLLYFIATFPLFFVALVTLVLHTRRLDERDRWAVAACFVLIPTSAWATCKSGGSYNSLLPGYLAMIALFVSRLEIVISWIARMPAFRATLSSASAALIVLVSFFVQFDRALAVLEVRHGDENYDAAVRAVSGLHGIVVSPQDPTIAYRAKHYIGRSLIFELDEHAVNGNWPGTLPDSLSQELNAADFVVQVRGFVPNPMFDSALPEHGFLPMPVESLSNSVYTIWSKPPRS